MAYIHFFSTFSETVKHMAMSGGYVTLFLVMLLEGLPLIGMAIPGHVAILTAGFLSATGVLDPLWVVAIGITGALAGDCVSFYLGRKYGWPLLEKIRPHFFISVSALDKARAMLDKHTGKALVLGRFNPVTRGIMPFFIGANKAPVRAFWIYDAAGTIAWIVFSVTVGYLLGLGFHTAASLIGKIAVSAVLVGALTVWGYRFVNIRFHIFRRFELFILGLNVISLYGLARTLGDAISKHPYLAGFDIDMNAMMVGFQSMSWSGPLVDLSLWINYYAGPVAVSTVTVVGGIWLSARRKWRSVIILLTSIGSTAFLAGWLKDIFMRVRPDDLLVRSLYGDPSFPSGHAAFSAALLVVAAYIFAPKIRSWVKRESFLAACVIIPIVIGLSRLALNVHWASDIVAGWSLGVFCATGSILFVRYVAALVYERVDKVDNKDGK